MSAGQLCSRNHINICICPLVLSGQRAQHHPSTLLPGATLVELMLSRAESAAGANLTCANHAFMVHPLLTETQEEYEASETQALGRIKRYGQAKKVCVWRFLVEDTIDEIVAAERAAR
jgi:hypothetical protein